MEFCLNESSDSIAHLAKIIGGVIIGTRVLSQQHLDFKSNTRALIHRTGIPLEHQFAHGKRRHNIFT